LRKLFDDPRVASVLLVLIAVLVRLVYLDRPTHFDELYTVLAAQGWSAEGIPRIADGVYERVQYYTILTAKFFELFGESLVVARIPPLIFGALLTLSVFLWTWRVAGRTAAWMAGLFVCLDPTSVEMSQFARFYSLHALLFFTGSICIYSMTVQGTSTRAKLFLSAAGVVLIFAAYETQQLTMIGLAGIALWLTVSVVVPWLTSSDIRPVVRWLAIGVALVVVAVAAILLFGSGEGLSMLNQYRKFPLHAAKHSNEFWFYHLHLTDRYQSLWPLFPIMLVAALAAKPRPVLFCAFVFCTALILLSFAGMKSWRYLFFATPFLFIIWSIALCKVFGSVWSWLAQTTDQARRAVAPDLPRNVIWGLVLAASAVSILFANGAPARTLLKPLGISISGKNWSGDWGDIGPYMKPWLERADVVIVSHELHALYYLGRYDLLLSKERLVEIKGDDFDRDRRTGRPIIASVEAIDRVLDCYQRGLVIADTVKGWRSPNVVDEAVASEISRHMVAIELPNSLKIRAFYWDHSEFWAPNNCTLELPNKSS